MSGLEIIGAIASAAQLLSLSLTILHFLRSLSSQCISAEGKLDGHARQIRNLSEVAALVERSPQLQTRQVGFVLERCVERARMLEGFLEAASGGRGGEDDAGQEGHREDDGGGLKVVGGRKGRVMEVGGRLLKKVGGGASNLLINVMLEKKVLKGLRDLETEMMGLVLCIATIDSNVLQRINVDISDIQRSLDEVVKELPAISQGMRDELPLIRSAVERLTEQYREQTIMTLSSAAADEKAMIICLSSLAATEQRSFSSEVLNRSKHACRWFQETLKYRYWYENPDSDLLWVTARAGCGKTTLAAHISQWVMARRSTTSGSNAQQQASQLDQEKQILLVFYFHKSNQEAEGNAAAALKSIISQFVHQVSEALPVLLRRYDAIFSRGNFTWPWDCLWEMFIEMVEHITLPLRIYIILDGVDECDTESRKTLLTCLRMLVEDKDPSSRLSPSPVSVLKIFVTSRPDECVFDILSEFQCLEIANTDTTSDMRRLIQTRIQSFASRRRLGADVSQQITSFLEDNAQGMFLWVVLIIEELERRDERLTDEVIASKLSRIPLTLIHTYESILRNPEAFRRNDMWRIIRWLVFARRALWLRELEVALCLESGVSRWYDFAGDVKFLCGSLARIEGVREEVSLVHQTARDFLQAFSEKARPHEAGGLHMDALTSEMHLAKICVEYLTNDDIFSELENVTHSASTYSEYSHAVGDFLARRQFICYAIENWAAHVGFVRNRDEPLSSMVVELLSEGKRRDGIMRLTYYINHTGNPFAPMGASPLHLASYFNFPWLVDMYIQQSAGAGVHAIATTGDTPLIWASEMGSTACAQKLLGAGADPNMVEYDGWSALHWAARNGHLDVVNLLIDHGADCTHKDSNGETALDWAAGGGYLSVVNAIEARMRQRPNEKVEVRVTLREVSPHSDDV